MNCEQIYKDSMSLSLSYFGLLYFIERSGYVNFSRVFFLSFPRLNLQTKPVDPTVEGGAQVQQVVNIECILDFMEAPVLNIQFRYNS